MIYSYGFSLTGLSHAEKGMDCQDAHKIKVLDNGWIIAAVADGVGSAVNSGIGARIAVDTAVSFCEEYMPWDYNTVNIKSMLRTAFNYAVKKISYEAKQQGNELESYDTTLTLVIYDGCKIIYGHSGDGGIIGLTAYGDYITITKQQKSEDNISVIPLRAGYTSWVIDTYEEELSAVLLLTDGMYEMLTPYLLRNRKPNVYVPLGMFFLDGNCFEYSEENRSAIDDVILNFIEGGLDKEIFYEHLQRPLKQYLDKEEAIEAVMESIRVLDYPMKLMSGVTDDKTIVGLIRSDRLPEEKPMDYFMEPDWSLLKYEWNKAAYPNLFRDKYKKDPAKNTAGNKEIKEKSKVEDEKDICNKTAARTLIPINYIDNKAGPLDRFMGTYYGPGSNIDTNIIDLPFKRFTENIENILQQIKHNSLNEGCSGENTGSKG